MSSLLFPFSKLSRENTQPENMCDIVFEKAEGRRGKVNRTSVYVEVVVRRILKKGDMRNFEEFTKKNICARIYFLIELKL